MVNTTRIHITGIVQGVGFRPFIYNLANKYNLKGFCLNDSRGVLLEVQGNGINNFVQEIKASPPPLSKIEQLATCVFPSKEVYRGFTIRENLSYAGCSTLISPDIAICHDCLRELLDPEDRRYHYPFINCTNCGPRYSIIRDVPYDRSATTMSAFTMCKECEGEYHDPKNRRFHAQPNACHNCGPRVWLEYGRQEQFQIADFGLQSSDLKSKISNNPDVIQKSIILLKRGAILAIKGLGGFHLACDATNHSVVKRLREKKRMSNKPFALMSPNVETIKRFCRVSEEEKMLLEGKVRPIVILEKILSAEISESVAPNNKTFGVMLPYTPLHSLLFSSVETGFIALVMTSGNRSDEPIIISNNEALERLSSVADFFLLHDRDIYMRVDDSIVISDCRFEISDLKSQISNQKSKFRLIRRARGFVPEPINLAEEMKEILACGAELKNTFCLTKGRKAIISQHIGDLEDYTAMEFFKEGLKNLKNSFRITPEIIAHDHHPDYLSTRFALEYAAQMHIPDSKVIAVQHHHAHIVSCMAEHGLNKKVIGVAFDGAGYGLDGNIWGGEFFVAGKSDFARNAYFQYVPMPGGNKAVREPWRMAVAYLYQTFGDDVFEVIPSFFKRFSKKDIDIIIRMIKKDVNSPLTSSAGRLFDAVSSILGIRDKITFEGEAAIELEMTADGYNNKAGGSYPYRIAPEKPNCCRDTTRCASAEPIVIDMSPLIKSVVEDFNNKTETGIISVRFHRTIADIILKISLILAEEDNIKDIVLSGGVFQNSLLLKLSVAYLTEEGFKVWFPRQVPANDGGISLGQAVVAWERLKGV